MALGVLEFTGAAATWRAPALVVAGTEDPALLLGGEKKNRRGYLQKLGPDRRLRASCPLRASEPGRCSGGFLEVAQT